MCYAIDQRRNAASPEPMWNVSPGSETVASTPSNIIKEPILIDHVQTALAQRSKAGDFGKGDVLIVLDTMKLGKSIVLESQKIRQKADTFAALHFGPKQSIDPQASAGSCFRHLLVMEAYGSDEARMPLLQVQPLDAPIPARCAAQEIEHHETVRTAWTRAYLSFFRMITTDHMTARSLRLDSNASISLPVIEDMVQLSEKYGVLQLLRSAIHGMSTGWMLNKTLFAAIADHATRWLKIAIKLEIDYIYHEAFIHVVGQQPVELDPELPELVGKNLMSRISKLRMQRYEVNERLMLTTLRDSNNSIVSQHNRPVVYNTANIWRDWVTEHIAATSSQPTGNYYETFLCDHGQSDSRRASDCLTVAGFYRTLYRACDSYLAIDDVKSSWARDKYEYDGIEVRLNLAELKKQAKEIVAPLVVSGLQYEKSDELPYLTCVEDVQVPWEEEGEQEAEDVDAMSD